MKSFAKSLKRQDGFTLVELMVVVAIIGLLSAVAIPNFKKYQAKSKATEAKLQLSAIYTAEQAFFSDYNMYAHCLTYMGFDPGPEAANRYYALGFVTPVAYDGNAFTAAQNSGLNNNATTGCPNTATAMAGGVNAVSNNASTWYAAGKGIGGAIANANNFIPASTNGTQATAATMTFTAGAGGIISQDFVLNTNNSQFTINNSKVFSNVRNGY